MAHLVIPPLPTAERGRSCVLNVDPTGTKWIYCSGNNIIVRGISSPEDTYVYTGHGSQKTSACSFSPNGSWVASADVTGLVKVWGAKGDHTAKSEFRLWAGAIVDIAWSPDSQRIVACGDGKEMMAKAFLFDTGNTVGEIIGHSKRINSCSFRPARPFRAATGGEDYLVCFHEGPPFKYARSMDKHTNFVNSVRFSPDGATLASGGSDSKIHLYDGATGEHESTWAASSGSVWGLAWSAKGQLGSVTGDKVVRIWEKGSTTPIKQFSIGDKLEDMPLGISWGTGPLTAVCLDHRLLYATEDSETLSTIYGSEGHISSIAYSSGAYFYGTANGYLCRLRVGENAPSRRIKLGSRVVQVFSSKTGGKACVAVLTANETIHYIDSDTENLEITGSRPLGGFAINGSFYKSGNLVVVLTRKNIVAAVSQEGVAWTRELKRTVLCLAALPELGNGPLLAIAYDGEGNEIAIQTATRPIEIYNEQGGVIHTIEAHKAVVSCMEFSPDGKYLASCDAACKVIVWNCSDWSQAAIWSFHTSKVTAVSWHPNSNLLATGSIDRSVYVWNVETSAREQKPEGHKDGVTGVAWGDRLASVGADGVLRVW